MKQVWLLACCFLTRVAQHGHVVSGLVFRSQATTSTRLLAVRRPIRRPVGASEPTPPTNTTLVNKDPSLLSDLSWDDFHLAPSLHRAVTQDFCFTKPTQIQAQTFRHIYQGRSVLGRARTGTGKTLAFLLPTLQSLLESPDFVPGRQVGALVVAPTRELAQQIADTATQLLAHAPLQWQSVQCMYGGTRMAKDVAPWRREQWPVVLVTTPGRWMDHVRETIIKKQKFPAVLSIRVMIWDETDRLIQGFGREMQSVQSALSKDQQRLLWSATLPPNIRWEDYLPKDHVRVDCVKEERVDTSLCVKQSYLLLAHMDDYVPTLRSLLTQEQEAKVVVFFPTAKLVRFFCEFFQDLPVLEIHSRMSQGSRSRVNAAFREAQRGILLTSDVSARGLDYPDVSLVIEVRKVV